MNVIEDFVKRIWAVDDIDKVGMVDKGVFIVHFKTSESMTAVCEMSGIFI